MDTLESLLAELAPEYIDPVTGDFTTQVSKDVWKNALKAALFDQLVEELEKAATIASLVTVQQIISAGNDYIEAAGLNPWVIAEGRADGTETFSNWSAVSALATAARIQKALGGGK